MGADQLDTQSGDSNAMAVRGFPYEAVSRGSSVRRLTWVLGLVVLLLAVGLGGTARAQHEREQAVHPYPRRPPMMYRTFMPGSSPASIAVWLENGVSYCWDAGTGFLRYAWTGGFVDNAEVFRGHVGGARARLIGEVFYRTDAGTPLRSGDPAEEPAFSFLGYRMREGRPEFRYRLGDLRVREWIRSLDSGTGLVRHFEIRGAEEPVWFVASDTGRIAYEASAGTWRGDRLQLTPQEAVSFTVTMRHEP